MPSEEDRADLVCRLFVYPLIALIFLAFMGVVAKDTYQFLYATRTPVAPIAPIPTEIPTQPTSVPVQWLVVGNTAGEGVYLRGNPVMAERLSSPLRDGTKLQVIGPDEDGDGQHWKHVEAPNGRQGWVPTQYVMPSSPP